MRNMMTGKHARRQAYGKLAWPGVLPLFFAAVALLCCSSCSEEDDTGTGTSSDTTDTDIEINLTLRTYKMATTAESDKYEVGSTYENYIDIANGDYKIYFFTNNDPGNTEYADDTWLATFDSNELVPVMSSDYTEYTLLGKVSEDFAEYVNGNGEGYGNGKFKVVVLANWGNYPTDLSSATTINDICTYAAGIYTHKEKSEFVLDKSNLIPFYGVHEYTEKTFTQGIATVLSEPIYLIRAMAKVEVIFEDDYVGLSDVVLHHYNNQGYCAPKGVYTNYTYQTDGVGDTYIDDNFGLHLVNDANDEGQDGRTLSFLQTQEREVDAENKVTQYETWVAYVPEYDNSEDDFSYIQVNFDGFEVNEDYRKIYFAEYENGTYDPDAGYYDIRRNTLYRFTVTWGGSYLNVHVDKWTDAYENNFTYGKESSEGGVEGDN